MLDFEESTLGTVCVHEHVHEHEHEDEDVHEYEYEYVPAISEGAGDSDRPSMPDGTKDSVEAIGKEHEPSRAAP